MSKSPEARARRAALYQLRAARQTVAARLLPYYLGQVAQEATTRTGALDCLEAARRAVRAADCLLDELRRTQPQGPVEADDQA